MHFLIHNLYGKPTAVEVFHSKDLLTACAKHLNRRRPVCVLRDGFVCNESAYLIGRVWPADEAAREWWMGEIARRERQHHDDNDSSSNEASTALPRREMAARPLDHPALSSA